MSVSNSGGTKIDSVRRLGDLKISKINFNKEGILYSLSRNESTSDICGNCIIDEVDYKKPHDVHYIFIEKE